MRQAQSLESVIPPAGEGAQGARAPAGADCRCLCGSLLARLVGAQVELKCRRCKRVVRIPIELPAPGSRDPGRAETLLAERTP